MASLVPESWGCIDVQDDFDNFEVTEIDVAFLMSLIDETQAEQECDDEGLMSVIQSLEAEIDPHMIINGRSLPEIEWDGNINECRLSDWGHANSQDCSASHDLDFSWMDMDDMTSFYCENEVDGLLEIGGVGDYSQFCYEVPLDEPGYDYLWQETNASMM